MEHAQSLEEYRAAAVALDEVNGLGAASQSDKTKQGPSSRLFAVLSLERARSQLKAARHAEDWSHLLHLLQRSLSEANYGGHLTEALYADSFAGTQLLVDEYCTSVVDGLDALRKKIAD